jgi:hypothetical protein
VIHVTEHCNNRCPKVIWHKKSQPTSTSAFKCLAFRLRFEVHLGDNIYGLGAKNVAALSR